MKEVTLKVLYIGKITNDRQEFTQKLSWLSRRSDTKFTFQGTILDNRYNGHSFDNYHRVYCAPIGYYFDSFRGEKLELQHYVKLGIKNDGHVGVLSCPYTKASDDTQVLVTECYFVDKDCNIIDNKFNDHLKANINFYNMIYIAEDAVKINCTGDFIGLIQYLKEFPNTYLETDSWYRCDEFQPNFDRYMKAVSYETTNIYNNEYVDIKQAIIPYSTHTLPAKLIDVLGLNETYSELAKLQLENERLNSRIEELESKLKSQSELEDEIAEMRKKLDVVKGLFI